PKSSGSHRSSPPTFFHSHPNIQALNSSRIFLETCSQACQRTSRFRSGLSSFKPSQSQTPLRGIFYETPDGKGRKGHVVYPLFSKYLYKSTFTCPQLMLKPPLVIRQGLASGTGFSDCGMT
ncbi:hypothetical protein STEG23_016811, partial [Scotinomys teguina]